MGRALEIGDKLTVSDLRTRTASAAGRCPTSADGSRIASTSGARPAPVAEPAAGGFLATDDPAHPSQDRCFRSRSRNAIRRASGAAEGGERPEAGTTTLVTKGGLQGALESAAEAHAGKQIAPWFRAELAQRTARATPATRLGLSDVAVSGGEPMATMQILKPLSK